MNALAPFLSRLRATWSGLAARERLLVGCALALVAGALLWWLALAPALATLRNAPAQHAELDVQLQRMQQLSAQAQAMQALPRTKGDESLKALDASVKQSLGATGQLSVVGERATVTLKGASAQALAQWLGQARANARALPLEARLAQNATRTGWDGTVLLALPAP